MKFANLGFITYVAGEPTPIEDLPSIAAVPESLRALKAAGHRHCAVWHGSLAGLCSATVERFFAVSGLAPSVVDTVLLTTSRTREYPELGTAMLDNHLNNVAHIEIGGAQCTNSLLALKVAAGLLLAGTARNVLSLSVNKIPIGESRLTFNGRTVAGDGAVACLVTCEPADFQIMGIEHVTNWGFVEEPDRVAAKLGAFSTMYENVVAQMSCVTRIDSGRVGVVISSNIPTYARFVAHILDLEPERAFETNIARLGHIFDCDYLINLADCCTGLDLPDGDVVMIGGMGAKTAALMALQKT